MKEYKIAETKIKIDGKPMILKSIPIGCTVDFEIIGEGKLKETVYPIKPLWKRILNIIGSVDSSGIRVYKYNLVWRSKYWKPRYFFRLYVTTN